MVTVDTSILRQLVHERLVAGLTGTGVTVCVAADDDPESGAWCRLVRLDYLQRRRNRGDAEMDHGDVQLEVQVFVTSDLVGQFGNAVARAMGHVAKALDGSCLRDTGTTHQLDLLGVQRREVPEVDQLVITGGTVTVAGVARRMTGDTIASLS